jgi:hypothetical protein
MDEIVNVVVERFFSMCVSEGELVDEDARQQWLSENLDSSFVWLGDKELIDMADEGLEHHGSFTIEGQSTVRQSLTFLAYYGIESNVNSAIQSSIDEHNLDECDGLSDSAPFDHDPDHVDDDLCYWHRPRWAVWKQIDELGLWADFTKSNPPNAIERLRDAIDAD